MMTFLAPAVMCLEAVAVSRKMPVDSTTTSTPSSFQGSAAGSLIAPTRIPRPLTKIASPLAVTSALRLPWMESCFSRWARVFASARSLTATTSISPLASSAVRKKTRPMRPKPLTPTRMLMEGLLVGRNRKLIQPGLSIGSKYTATQRTRATVSTPTRAAPADRKMRAHSAAVAPVVSTSSTTTTWRPAAAGRKPRSTAVSAAGWPTSTRHRAGRGARARASRRTRGTARGRRGRARPSPTPAPTPAGAGSAALRRAQRVPALALRTAVLPRRRGGAADLAAVRPVEAVAQAQRAAILVERVVRLAAPLEHGAEEGVDHRQVGRPHLELLELVGRLVEHLELEVDAPEGGGQREVVGHPLAGRPVERDP